MEQAAWAFVLAAAAGLAAGPWAIRRLTALSLFQPLRYADCPPLQVQQAGKQGTPTMGGLLALPAAIAGSALCGGLGAAAGWLIALAAAALAGLGLADDVLKLRRANAGGLRKLPKLLIALGIGGGVGVLTADPSLGYRELAVPWLGRRVDVGWLWVPLAMGVVAGSAHAVNLTDGMDGLAAGLLWIAYAAVGLLAWRLNGDAPLIWCAALAGGCAGFLWFNGHPARVFLGDVGALGLGSGLGVAALLSHQALALLLIGGVFVAEAGSVIIQVFCFKRWGVRPFRVAPLHHHIQLGGVAETHVVMRLWIVGGLLAGLGVALFWYA
jgi:phospho-N-acetylmuramoyl-pentapeptide-transferase